MVTSRALRRTAALAAALLLTACSGDGPAGTSSPDGTTGTATSSQRQAECDEVVDGVVAEVQRYVDAYGAPVSGSDPRQATETTAPDDEALQSALRGATQTLGTLGCDQQEFQADVRTGLDQVRSEGPIARAVLLRLTATLTGTAEATATTVTVRPDDDLPAELATLATGSVVRLTAGTHRLTEPVALLEGVTLRGVSPGRTVIESTAADAALLVLTDGKVELSRLTLRHVGRKPGDLVVGGPTASLVLTRAHLQGARAGQDGAGGNGVLMTARQGATPDRGTTLEVTGAELSGNAAAGILLTGGHVASIRGSRFVDNAECGVCFTDATSGAVRDSTLVDNRVGVLVLERASPALIGDTVEGGDVAVQVSGSARPVVRDMDVVGAGRAGIVFSDRSRGRVEDTRCEAVPFGIVVAPDALPFLGDNDCTLARGE